MSAAQVVLVSRFPDTITPGALPILPTLVSIHDRHGGGFLLFRWFEVVGRLEQAAPEFYETLADAFFRVPSGYEPIPCPEDFARLAYRLPQTKGVLS